MDAEIGIERLLHLLDRLQQLRQTFEREELALQRNENGVRRRHRIHGEKIEGGRTIDQHIGVVARRVAAVERCDCIAEAEGAVARGRNLKLDPGQIHRRGGDMQTRHRRLQDRVAQLRFADQHVVGRAFAVAAINAETGRRVALRIKIDDQHPLADGGQSGAQIDRGRGLADATLLIGERQDARALHFFVIGTGGHAGCLQLGGEGRIVVYHHGEFRPDR